jgi:hypothetical protein
MVSTERGEDHLGRGHLLARDLLRLERLHARRAGRVQRALLPRLAQSTQDGRCLLSLATEEHARREMRRCHTVLMDWKTHWRHCMTSFQTDISSHMLGWRSRHVLNISLMSCARALSPAWSSVCMCTHKAPRRGQKHGTIG